MRNLAVMFYEESVSINPSTTCCSYADLGFKTSIKSSTVSQYTMKRKFIVESTKATQELITVKIKAARLSSYNKLKI